MYSTIILLLFFAFLLLYNLSKKSKWEGKPQLAVQLETRKTLSRGISFSLMLVACLLLIFMIGTGAGIFAFIVIQMAMGSLIVLLFPFHYITAKHVVILYLLFIGFESFIF